MFPYISLCEICDPGVQVMNADIPMKVLKTRREPFNCIQRNYSTIGDNLDSVNMLRMRRSLHLFDNIWLYN